MHNAQEVKDLLDGLTNKELTSSTFFKQMKEVLQNRIEDEADLTLYYNRVLKLLRKTRLTGQKDLQSKLVYHMYCIEKQREIKEAGIHTFVYLDDVKDYIERVTEKDVKIIELESYPREIPDDVIDSIEKYKELFTDLYVVYTDYTDEAPEEIQNKYIEKDPILFGTLEDKDNREFDGRMYFIADWIDEYCDLTLDRMIKEYKDDTKTDMAYTLEDTDVEELKHASKLYNKDMTRSDFRVAFVNNGTTTTSLTGGFING